MLNAWKDGVGIGRRKRRAKMTFNIEYRVNHGDIKRTCVEAPGYVQAVEQIAKANNTATTSIWVQDCKVLDNVD